MSPPYLTMLLYEIDVEQAGDEKLISDDILADYSSSKELTYTNASTKLSQLYVQKVGAKKNTLFLECDGGPLGFDPSDLNKFLEARKYGENCVRNFGVLCDLLRPLVATLGVESFSVELGSRESFVSAYEFQSFFLSEKLPLTDFTNALRTRFSGEFYSENFESGMFFSVDEIFRMPEGSVTSEERYVFSQVASETIFELMQ